MAGRPKTFKTVEEMQEKIEEYFDMCKGNTLKDKEDNIIFDKYGMPVIIGGKPPTVTGLALHLGFNSRQTLLNYQATRQFVDTITRAKMRIEEYAECRLYDKDGCNGAKFNLVNNFGWKDKSETEHSGNIGMQIVDDIK